MVPDPGRGAKAATERPEVMASIDTDGLAPRFIIADITSDEAWVSTPEQAAASLLDWR